MDRLARIPSPKENVRKARPCLPEKFEVEYERRFVFKWVEER
ncbi:MAG: hypothetical protein WBW16_13685 [Bacteroidota bacterium]